uniref:Uncharacterized protein n=1 Tax=Myotis myotis TaxID=51298 RepID=A0A7J7QW75_MYOMY|nr:hypothetical protein mMyoMyo1_011294 [Myotis myotis]
MLPVNWWPGMTNTACLLCSRGSMAHQTPRKKRAVKDLRRVRGGLDPRTQVQGQHRSCCEVGFAHTVRSGAPSSSQQGGEGLCPGHSQCRLLRLSGKGWPGGGACLTPRLLLRQPSPRREQWGCSSSELAPRAPTPSASIVTSRPGRSSSPRDTRFSHLSQRRRC